MSLKNCLDLKTSNRRSQRSLIKCHGNASKIVILLPAEILENKRALSDRLLNDVRSHSEVEIVISSSSDELVEAAHKAATAFDIVVAMGGDGTVSRVATGIFGSAAALGIIPFGSTNIIARSLGIPANPRNAIALLVGSHSRRVIDIGRCDDRCFLHMGGAGFDAEIFRQTSLEWKRRTGWIAYLPPAVQ